MKTIQVTVERNFHIMNENRFLMEKISVTIGLEPLEDEGFAMDYARNEINRNFKAAYPNVYPYLNFDEIIQVKKKEIFVGAHQFDAIKKTYSSGAPPFVKLPDEPEEIYDGNNFIPTKPKSPTEKIIEQINASTVLDKNQGGLLSFEFMLKKFPDAKPAFDKKLKELQKQPVNDTSK